ncbi:MarR family winged helix-turn-helix transcriptional regulator [Arenibacter sp. M-2]|uniref:MarR family winged helix-turn-helix transcriptional regulator n=1 Tax=Arenibacter sp. M-2 TaxID=3053612 RepID=UPI00256FE5A9|nr:MarR family winged helix-turn-helix transcriptional regulator [Arenibacter sp. M-2]MDL5511149.1 MarR family winged helix-turn-helix transcriptional regulator [Arenibacter sp. M-2]
MGTNSVIELRKAGQQYTFASLQMHETIAKSVGFSATDHKYLGFFLQKGKLTAGELAKLSGLTTGAVTGLIDRFETKKLVKREFDATDRRKVFIVPFKEKIMKLFEPYYKDFQEETEKLIATFSRDERKIIQDFFEKSIKLMKDTHNMFNN